MQCAGPRGASRRRQPGHRHGEWRRRPDDREHGRLSRRRLARRDGRSLTACAEHQRCSRLPTNGHVLESTPYQSLHNTGLKNVDVSRHETTCPAGHLARIAAFAQVCAAMSPFVSVCGALARRRAGAYHGFAGGGGACRRARALVRGPRCATSPGAVAPFRQPRPGPGRRAPAGASGAHLVVVGGGVAELRVRVDVVVRGVAARRCRSCPRGRPRCSCCGRCCPRPRGCRGASRTRHRGGRWRC